MTQFLLTASFFLALSVLTFAASNTQPAAQTLAQPATVISTAH